jgi:hypothetical protein
MIGIILEGVLFVALLATMAALLFFAVLECPIHGMRREEELVRLPSGSRICPACYKEALHE